MQRKESDMEVEAETGMMHMRSWGYQELTVATRGEDSMNRVPLEPPEGTRSGDFCFGLLISRIIHFSRSPYLW